VAEAQEAVDTLEVVAALAVAMGRMSPVQVVLVHQDKATAEVLLPLDKQGGAVAVLQVLVNQRLLLIELGAMVAHQKCLILIIAQGHLLVVEVALLMNPMVRRGLAPMAVAVEVATLLVMLVMVL
jgi:hypothetical protein